MDSGEGEHNNLCSYRVVSYCGYGTGRVQFPPSALRRQIMDRVLYTLGGGLAYILLRYVAYPYLQGLLKGGNKNG